MLRQTVSDSSSSNSSSSCDSGKAHATDNASDHKDVDERQGSPVEGAI